MAPADAQELKTTEVTVYTKVSALLRRTPSTHEYSKPWCRRGRVPMITSACCDGWIDVVIFFRASCNKSSSLRWSKGLPSIEEVLRGWDLEVRAVRAARWVALVEQREEVVTETRPTVSNSDTRFHEGKMRSRKPLNILYHNSGTFEECSGIELIYNRTVDSYGVNFSWIWFPCPPLMLSSLQLVLFFAIATCVYGLVVILGMHR